MAGPDAPVQGKIDPVTKEGVRAPGQAETPGVHGVLQLLEPRTPTPAARGPAGPGHGVPGHQALPRQSLTVLPYCLSRLFLF